MKKVAFITSRMFFLKSIFMIILSLVIFYSLDMISPTNSHSSNDTNTIKDKTKSAGSLHAEGLRLYYAGKYKEAIEVWLEELNLTPKNANTHNNIGIAYQSLEDYESAVPYHKRAIEINKNFGPGYYDLGIAYIMLGKNEEAKQVLTKALDLNFRPFDSYYFLGTAHKAQKEYDDARDALLKSLEFKKNPFAYYLLGDIYFDMKDYKQAKDAYLKALETNNESLDLAKLYNSIGLVNEKLGDSKEAEKAYKKAKEIEGKRRMDRKSCKTPAMSNTLILIGGLVISLFIGLISIPPLRIFFRTGMRGMLLKGAGGVLFACSFMGLTIWYISLYSLNKGNSLADSIFLIIILVTILGGILSIVGVVMIETIESGLRREIYSKTTFWKRITGEVPILKLEKLPPPLISKRTGLILGIFAMALGSLVIIPYILFDISASLRSFFIGSIFAFIFGLLLVIFSIFYLDKGRKSPDEKLKD